MLAVLMPLRWTCPKCKRTDLTVVGPRTTTLWEYVPGYFEQHVHVQEALVCPCGEYAVMAPCPDKPFENARHGPNFIAHLIVSKCLDAIPLHRLDTLPIVDLVAWSRSAIES